MFCHILAFNCIILIVASILHLEMHNCVAVPLFQSLQLVTYLIFTEGCSVLCWNSNAHTHECTSLTLLQPAASLHHPNNAVYAYATKVSTTAPESVSGWIDRKAVPSSTS